MPLRIDPRLPLVWRTPNSLQFGVDSPAVVLHSVSNAEERMLSALVGGTTETALALIAEAAGGTAADVDELLRQLAPALVAAPDPATMHPPADIVVIGTGPTAERLRYALDERGMLLRDPETARLPDLAVIVAHFVIDPADRARWLNTDVPHLPVLLGDREARVGPLVEPGETACLQCLELHRRDADAAWPAMAAQLWGRAASVDTPLFAGELVCEVLRTIDQRLALGRRASALSVSIDAGSGERVRREWSTHPECGCAALPGSDSVGGHLRAVRHATTTGPVAPVLA